MPRRATDAAEAPTARDAIRRWLVPALLLSLLLHALFYGWSKNIPVESMSDSFYEKIVPRTFHLERVDIDPSLLEPEPDPQTSLVTPRPIELPEEKITFETSAPAVTKSPPRLDTALLKEKPEIPASPHSAPGSPLPASDDALARELLAELPAIVASTPQPGSAASIAPPAGTTPQEAPGFSDLDALLARTGPLTPDTAPILMPADLLFEYDAHELQPQALGSLKKLGTLLKRNPSTRFLIEGHTDSFGPDDYNLRLSLLRAESVKNWLASEFGIPAESISTRGFGESRLAASGTGTIEEQGINRRVEIVILGETP